MKLVVVIGIAALMAGCAAPTVYSRPGASDAVRQKEFAECEFEAIKATGSGPGGTINDYNMTNTIANDIATGIRRSEIMRACLFAKGYTAKSQ